MINLLIDNCSLRDLVDIHGYSKFLVTLENHINNGLIQLYAHEVLLDEWNKYKNQWKREKEQKLLGNTRSDLDLYPGAAIKPFTNKEHIILQINKIDELLDKAYLLVTPDKIKNEFSLRYRKKLAPFHIKKDSLNDWELIGTFCNYCQNEGIRELYFLSSNTTDFSNSNMSDLEIHEDFKSRFPKVQIHYFSDFIKLFDRLGNSNGLPLELITYTMVANSEYRYKATYKKNVLDSLIFIFTDLYSEIDFIPLHILRKLYPFASAENEEAYYDKFTIYHVSDEMYSFFLNIKVTKNGEVSYADKFSISHINNFDQKVKLVLHRLTQNYIFNIKSKNSTKSISVFYTKNIISCTCLTCTFNRLNFTYLLENLNLNKEIEVKELLKYAYINMKLGNYKKANSIYDKICEIILAKNNSKRIWMIYFIAKYNQKHLSKFLNNFFGNETIDFELINKLKLIDPIEEAVKLKTHTDYNLLNFICTEDFFTEPFQKIIDLASQLKDNYHSTLRGGWSRNQLIWELIEEFARLDAFVNLNSIIFDGFSNFTKIFEVVLDGIFASYAQREHNNDHFSELDNYWILKIILYGDVKTIRRLVGYYNITTFKYNSGDTGDENIRVLIENLISNQSNLISAKKQGLDPDNLQFDNNYAKFIQNAIYISSLIELDSENNNSIGQLILKYIQSDVTIDLNRNDAINEFFRKKGKHLNKRLLDRFLKYLLKNHTYRTGEILYEIIDSYKLGKLNLSPKEIDCLVFQHFEKCNICDRIHQDHLFPLLYKNGNNQVKEYVKVKVTKYLNDNYKFDFYYLASIYNVIDFDIKILNREILNYQVKQSPKSTNSKIWGVQDFYFPKVDQILNLAFQNEINTNSKLFKKFSKINLYYKWLLNMDSFNYEKFEVTWALHYHTIYFLNRMSKSEKFKTYIRNYLLKQNHEGLERLLIKITNFY